MLDYDLQKICCSCWRPKIKKSTLKMMPCFGTSMKENMYDWYLFGIKKKSLSLLLIKRLEGHNF